MIISFLAVVLFSGLEITPQIAAILIGSLAILAFGLWDDFKNLSWKIQLGFQLLLVFFVVFIGYQIDYLSLFPGITLHLDIWQINFFGFHFFLLSAIAVAALYLIIINAVNWMDGIDGLAASIGIVASLSVMLVSLLPQVNQPAVAILCLILSGALLAFLWLNYPPAKIIAGTSGSYFIGFVLASLAIMAGTKIATLLIVLALPVMDAFWVIFNRAKNKQSIFSKDPNRRHFHYQLRKIGWSDQKILLSYFFFVFFVFLLTLIFDNRQHKLLILLLEAFFIGFFIYFVNRKVKSN